MRASNLLLWLQISIAASYFTKDPQKQAFELIEQLQKQANSNIRLNPGSGGNKCSKKNIAERKEWGSLSKKERLDYIRAVECLQKKPPQSDPALVPGARSRFEDFSSTHILRTNHVHFSGLFFPFHRYFVWLYEKALQDECGYKGSQPYWDWTLSWQDPRKSTVFDGSPYSLGSNGEAIPHPPTNISAFGIDLTIAPGTGGGCVHSGPFSNYSVLLGPVAFEPKGADGGLAYNPRCLSRDISLEWANNTKPTDVTSLLMSYKDLPTFATQMEALNGIHTGGHFSIGGINLDPFSAAGDPVFWLHHASVDRLWTIWQNLDPKNRTKQTWGTETAFNNPPSPNVTLNTLLDFGILSPKKLLSDLVSVTGGPFCYEYV